MKLSTPTLFAILATSAVVSAAPTAMSGARAEFGADFAADSTVLVKKSDVSDALSIIEQLGALNQKRALAEEDPEQLLHLSKRADSLLSELITSLTNSGIIGEVWDALTKDSELKSVLAGLVKSAVQTAITQGPALIKAVWNSGLIQSLFKSIYNNPDLRATLWNVAKTLFGSGLNLLKAFLASKNNSSGATAAATKRGLDVAAQGVDVAARSVDMASANLDDYIDKRDLASTITTVVNAIKNTGIVQGLVQKVLADPEASVAFLTKVLKNGLVAGEAIFKWAQSSGILKSGLNWVAQHGGALTSEIATFLGGLIASGQASTSDVDNASTIASTAATTVATTAATPAAAAAATTTALAKRRLY